MVPLCLVAKVDGKIIPIEINQFRNSNLGIIPLKYVCEKENDKSNFLEKERLEKEIEEAQKTPYFSEENDISINIVGYITMVGISFIFYSEILMRKFDLTSILLKNAMSEKKSYVRVKEIMSCI